MLIRPAVLWHSTRHVEVPCFITHLLRTCFGGRGFRSVGIFRRSYGSWSQHAGSLGVGWTHTYDWRIETNLNEVCVFSSAESGVTDGVHKFSPVEPGKSVSNEEGCILKCSEDGFFSMVTPGNVTCSFDGKRRLERIETWNGTAITLTRDGKSGVIVRADHSDGKSLTFEKDEAGSIVKVLAPDPSVWVEYACLR